MHVRVRLFAMQREAAATRELGVEVAEGATVADAWDAVVRLVPALAPGRETLRFAVNGAYADTGAPVVDGDEVAAIPPVSGGDGTANRRRRAGSGSFRSTTSPSRRRWPTSWRIAWRRRRTVRW